MAKGVYIGGASGSSTEVPFNASNLSKIFYIVNGDGTSGWEYSDANQGDGVAFKPKNYGIDSSTAEIKLILKKNLTNFKIVRYKVATEQGEDEFTVTSNGIPVLENISGSITGENIILGGSKIGDTLVLTYSKDFKDHANERESYFVISADPITEILGSKVKKMYLGMGGKARKVKKGYIGVNGVARLFFEEKIPLSKCAEGSLVKINEGGKLVEFYVAKHNYESELNGAGRTLLVRKDCYDERVFHTGTGGNNYMSSEIERWLNHEYKNLLHPEIQAEIGYTKFKVLSGGGTSDVVTRSRSIFLLSTTEFGESLADSILMGSELPIANTLKKAFLNGTSVSQWTRSARRRSGTYVWAMRYDGEPKYYNYDVTNGVRPAFTLPENYLVDTQVYMWRKYKSKFLGKEFYTKTQVQPLTYTGIGRTLEVYVSSGAGLGREYVGVEGPDPHLKFVYLDSTGLLRYRTDPNNSHQWKTSSYVKPQGSRGDAYQAIILSKFTTTPRTLDDFVNYDPDIAQYSVKGSASGNGNVYMLVLDHNGSSSPYWRYAIYEITFVDEYGEGDYIGEVYSDDPTAYPTEGKHSDGYWYVRY